MNFEIEYRRRLIDVYNPDHTMQSIVTLQTFAGLEILGLDERPFVVRPSGVVGCATNWYYQALHVQVNQGRGRMSEGGNHDATPAAGNWRARFQANNPRVLVDTDLRHRQGEQLPLGVQALVDPPLGP